MDGPTIGKIARTIVTGVVQGTPGPGNKPVTALTPETAQNLSNLIGPEGMNPDSIIRATPFLKAALEAPNTYPSTAANMENKAPPTPGSGKNPSGRSNI